MRKIALFSFPILLAIANPSANAETVEWYVNNFPPVTITVGPDAGKGWANKRMQIIATRTPEFHHETVDASGVRMFEDMKTKPNVCSAFLLKTPEREAYIEFSQPFSWIVPNVVVTTAARYPKLKPYLNERGDLRLEQLLQDGKHRIGSSPTRSYGKGMDTVLKKFANQPPVVIVPSNNFPAGRLLKLIGQDEYDVTPGYAEELNYMARENGIKSNELVYLTVAEQPPLIATYVGCSKSALGKRVIATVDRLLNDKQVQKEDTAAYRSWLDEKTATRYDMLLQEMAKGK